MHLMTEGKDLLSSVTQIRHTAVHRERLSASDMITYLRDAKKFLHILGDTSRLAQIAQLHDRVCGILSRLDKDEKEAFADLNLQNRDFESKQKALEALKSKATSKIKQRRGAFRAFAADATTHAVYITMGQTNRPAPIQLSTGSLLLAVIGGCLLHICIYRFWMLVAT